MGSSSVNYLADGILKQYQDDFAKDALFRRQPLANVRQLASTICTSADLYLAQV